MEWDALTLSRIQFAFTAAFHYIYPPLSIGLGLALVIMEGTYLRTRNDLYQQVTRFWVKVFGLIFALGVATGIVMEFEFGTNWSTYSRYVGDVFGSALAAEGIFAFFLESGFLAILLFGWDKVKPRTHFFSTIMVCFGAHMSAIWIVAANSWQQTPTGHHIVIENGAARAEIVDFWAMVFSPSFIDRISHTFMAAWQAGAFFVISVGAFYLIKKRFEPHAKFSIKVGLVIALFASIMQLVTGHSSAQTLAETQPAKLAAFEAHYQESAPADLYLFGWVHEQSKDVTGVAIPGMASFLAHGDFSAPLTGLEAFAPEDRPPVNFVFQTYHAMVAIGLLLIALSVVGTLGWWRGWLFTRKWLLRIFVLAVLLPQIANQLGWISAEVGRQPWIVYGLLRTSHAVSPNLSATEVAISLALFGGIYLLLFILFIFLLNEKIKHGPDTQTTTLAHRAG